MKPRSLAALAALVVTIVVAAVATPAVLGRHDGDPQPGITDWGRPDGGARLVRVTVATTPPHPVEPAMVVRPEQDFAFDLLSRLAKSADPDTNTTASPASLAIALGMLQLGARGETAEQIAAALHTSRLGADTQADSWHALTASWASAAKAGGLSLETANSLWQQAGSSIERSYLNALATFYDTGVWQTDFQHDLPGSLAALNAWTSDHTHGRITKLFDQGSLDSTTRLVLANAVYFKAAWARPFDASETSGGTFTHSDGSRSEARFMHSDTSLASAVTPDYDAVELPYVGGRFSALAIMPTKTSLTAFTSSLDASRLASIVSGLHSQQVQLALPTFETSSVLELDDALKAMGVRAAFSRQADLSGIAKDLHVSAAIQRTYLKVAEKGTEAAAVTGIGVAGSAAVPTRTTPITLDHPFLFLIRDTVTGALLFTSQIENPQA